MANNFLLAKIAADVNKPNGQYEVGADRDKILEFVSSLPTRKIPGIGKVAEKELAAFDMTKMADVRERLYILSFVYTDLNYKTLMKSALGLTTEELDRSDNNNNNYDNKDRMLASTSSSSPLFKRCKVSSPHKSPGYENNNKSEEEEEDDSSEEMDKQRGPRSKRYDEVVRRKGISVERTFRCISTLAEHRQKLREICNHLEIDMAREDLAAKKFTLKLKTNEFAVLSRCKGRDRYLKKAGDIFALMNELLTAEQPITLRLLGVRASSLLSDTNTTASSSLMRGFLDGNLNVGAKTNANTTTTTTTTTTTDEEVTQCPICEGMISGSLDEFNKHIDACLDKQEEEHISQSQPYEHDASTTAVKCNEDDGKGIEIKIEEDEDIHVPCPVGFSPDVWNCLPRDIKLEQVQSMKLSTTSSNASGILSMNRKKMRSSKTTEKLKSSLSMPLKGLITNCFQRKK